jgi:hypothetical protein
MMIAPDRFQVRGCTPLQTGTLTNLDACETPSPGRFPRDKITIMTTRGQGMKKLAETRYVEEARCVSSIFPLGELVLQEKPDFLLRSDSETMGIEVTELCR